jgi:FMN phosphatase YigB (HAD superfamily)
MSKIPVFDIGDTLTPSRRFAKDVFERELKRQGVENPPEYPFEGYNSNVIESISEWFKEAGIDADAEAAVKKLRNKKIERMEDFGKFEMLRKVEKEIDVPGIVSDNKVASKKFWEKVFDDRDIDLRGFVVSEELGLRKPHMEIFEEFLRRTKVEGEDCVYFGNRGDIDCVCEQLGMDFVWVQEFETFNTEYSGKSIRKLDFETVARYCI